MPPKPRFMLYTPDDVQQMLKDAEAEGAQTYWSKASKRHDTYHDGAVAWRDCEDPWCIAFHWLFDVTT